MMNLNTQRIIELGTYAFLAWCTVIAVFVAAMLIIAATDIALSFWAGVLEGLRG